MNIETLDKKEYRKFGLTMAAVIAILFGFIIPWLFNLDRPTWPLVIAGIFLVWSILLPNSMGHIYKPWLIFGHYIGIFNTKIILAVVFFAVFLPVALILKLLKKDAMNRNYKKPSIQSFWKKSKKQSKSHMEKVY